jgi:4-carboxymuconolactone decarboxylase
MKNKERGDQLLQDMFGALPEATGAFKGIDELEREHLFGNIWQREGLSKRDRSLITVAVLTALGWPDELRIHLRGAMKNGLRPKELEEVMIHLAHYCGWPAGINGLKALEELAKKRIS